MIGSQLVRLGLLMEPEPGNSLEIEGVLNPAVARGRDGQLYLFPRLVASGNYSRIGIARVRFNGEGDPIGVDRLGIALEPEADYERRSDGGGGCEDPRITFIEGLQQYVMTYTAFSSQGPRIAVAVSEDLFRWRRLGLARFAPFGDIEFDSIDNKDASGFPVAIADPSGQLAMAIVHRPLFPGTRPEKEERHVAPRSADPERESIWISYCSTSMAAAEPHHLCHFGSHRRLAAPVAPWEQLKIGGGTPPVLTRHGWLLVYHGVSAISAPEAEHGKLRYSAGVMILSKEHPNVILYRSPEPVLTPDLPQESHGTIADVVFPTGIDRRDDLGSPDRFDVYYGMGDSRIGVARLDLSVESWPRWAPPSSA